MTRDEMLDLCRRWEEANNHRDFAAIADLYSATAQLERPMAGSLIGPEGVMKINEGFFGAFPDATVTIEPPLVDGDRVAFVAEIAGTQVGSFMGLAPTGKAIRFRLVFLWDVHEGRIVRDRRLYDFTGLLVQVGVIKAKPA